MDFTEPNWSSIFKLYTGFPLHLWLCVYFAIFPLLSGCEPLNNIPLSTPISTLSENETAPPPPPPSSAPTTPPSKVVGRLPALGYAEISETVVLAAAHSFVSLGLRKAGYEYVNIDDSLAHDIHALGLKIGIYSDAGTETCAGYPGSLGYEATDAATWESWDIDYNCNVPVSWNDTSTPPGGDWYNSNSAIRFRDMGDAIAFNVPPVQFSLCIWGEAHVWTWGARVGHSWRMSGDSTPTWNFIKSIMNGNVGRLSSVNFFAHNDMDMMEIGNGNLTIQEERTHFAVWAFMKSPILLGTDLTKLSSEEIKIITNAELLAFHQDSAFGKPAMPYISSTTAATEPPQFYSGKSVRGTHVFVVNTNDTSATFNINFADVPGLHSRNVLVHDMWTSRDLGIFSGSYNITLAAHDTAALLVT
ncbi:glycoside hydrolase [Russula aff. rugulosa BPL654]|nr:glycoside hydrolase [Russula aff. rugulosa BPL654]